MFTRNYNDLFVSQVSGIALTKAKSTMIATNGTAIVNSQAQSNGYYIYDIFTLMENVANGSYLDYGTTGSSSSKVTYGVAFGNGTAEPTVDDLKFSGDYITGLTKGSNITLNTQVFYGEGYTEQTVIYTITNTTDANITISEVGLFGGWYYHDTTVTNVKSYRYPVLFERTLLEAPIAIEPTAIGQVTYTIRINHPVV